MMNNHYKTFLAATMGLFSLNAVAADWSVDTAQSRLSFISVKKINVAENYQFHQFSGKLNGVGDLSVTIDLSSVDTHGELRNQRMRDLLFDVSHYASATFSAHIAPAIIDELAVGSSEALSVAGTLALHGQSHPLTLELLVSRLTDRKLLVNTAYPVILNVEDYNLVKGIDTLRDLAKLPNISHAVPVSFYLSLTAQ